MTRTRLVAVVVILLVVAGVVGALATGFGPAPAGSSGDDIEEFPTETSSDGSMDSDSSTGGGGAQADTPPFTFVIDRIEQCGTTCRDVTVTLTNKQSSDASNVTVYTRIYAGNSTDEDDRIWQGKEAVGSMDAERSVTRTQRVSLTFGEAYNIRQNDGWITVETTVQSADRTMTFTERRKVA